MFSAVVIGAITLPAGLGGYALQYAWMAAGALLLLVTQRLDIRPEIVLLGGMFTVLGLISAILAPDLWLVREYIRAVLFLYLFVVVDDPTRRTILVAAATAVVAFITFDFVALYLLDIEVLKTLLYQRGMQNYLGHYWRHVGFLGNPNSSAAFYALVIVSGVAGILSGALQSLARKLLLSYCLILSVILMTFTLSRTALIATSGAVLIMIGFRINRARQLLVGVVFVSLAVLIWLTDAWGIQSRFATATSLLVRISLWQSLLGSLTAGEVVVGGWRDAAVVDNDPIYFLHNFGLLGAIMNYLVVLIVLVRLWVANLRTLTVGFSALVILLGMGMGFFADPKFALLIFAGSALIPRQLLWAPGAPRLGRSGPGSPQPGTLHQGA